METKKINKFVMKDFIKENPVGPRLQSLRLPRDLSLGGSKLPKKIFRPNLNVSRSKDKTKQVSKREKGTKDSRREFQNSQKQRFVQSTGVFSEGIGGAVRIPEKRIYAKEAESSDLKIKKLSSVSNKKIENEVSNCLIKYEEDSDNDINKESDAGFTPINWNTNLLSNESLKDEIKTEVLGCSSILETYNDNHGIYNFNPSLTLWQLPDSIGMKTKMDKKLVDCKLTDLSEGKIGKLCVKKSGKVDVYIGNIKYELEPAEHELFTEEIVSLSAQNPDEFVATVLSKIVNRFVLNPSWQDLLK